MTTTFFIPPERIQGDLVELPADEVRHVVQVLRGRRGDEIVAVDGEGGWYRIQLKDVGKKHAIGEIVERKRDVGEPSFHLTIGIGLLKNQNRFEVFAEKAAELGVSRIVPLLTHRTEKQSIKSQRVERLLTAAMKQCGRSRLVELAPLTEFETMIADANQSLKLIAHEQSGSGASLVELLESNCQQNIVALVGPEGGFTEEEIERATVCGFKVAALGERRLRAETAALAVCAGVMLALDRDKW